MNTKNILRKLGFIKTPKYSVCFAANNPFAGTWYTVRFTDGKTGMVIDKHNGTYDPVPRYTKDKEKVFVDFADAADSVYSEFLRTKKNSFLDFMHSSSNNSK